MNKNTTLYNTRAILVIMMSLVTYIDTVTINPVHSSNTWGDPYTLVAQPGTKRFITHTASLAFTTTQLKAITLTGPDTYTTLSHNTGTFVSYFMFDADTDGTLFFSYDFGGNSHYTNTMTANPEQIFEDPGTTLTLDFGDVIQPGAIIIGKFSNNQMMKFIYGANWTTPVSFFPADPPVHFISVDRYQTSNPTLIAVCFGSANTDIKLIDYTNMSDVGGFPVTGTSLSTDKIGRASAVADRIQYIGATSASNWRWGMHKLSDGSSLSEEYYAEQIGDMAELIEMKFVIVTLFTAAIEQIKIKDSETFLSLTVVTLSGMSTITFMDIAVIEGETRFAIFSDTANRVLMFDLKHACNTACGTCNKLDSMSSLGPFQHGCATCANPATHTMRDFAATGDLPEGDCFINCLATEYPNATNTACLPCPTCCDTCELSWDDLLDQFGDLTCTPTPGYTYTPTSNSCALTPTTPEEEITIYKTSPVLGQDQQILLTSKEEINIASIISNLRIDQGATQLTFQLTKISLTEIIFTFNEPLEFNGPPLIFSFYNVESESGASSTNYQSFKHYPIKEEFQPGDEVTPLTKYENLKTSIDRVSYYGPLLASIHPSLLIIFESVAFVKLLPYTSIVVPERFQIFMFLIAKDKEEYFGGAEIYNILQASKGGGARLRLMENQQASNLETQKAINFLRLKNPLFSLSMVYTLMIGIKLPMRYLIILLTALLYWLAKKYHGPGKKSVSQKILNGLFYLSINLMIVLNFEVLQVDFKIAAMGYNIKNTFFDKLFIILDMTIFAATFLYLYHVWLKTTRNHTSKDHPLDTEINNFFYDKIFLFQPNSSSKHLNNSQNLVPIRLLDNIAFLARVLCFKLTLYQNLNQVILLNIVNTFLVVYLVKKVKTGKDSGIGSRGKYTRFAVIFKIKWIVESVIIFFLTMNYFFMGMKIYADIQIYSVISYIMLCLLTTMFIIVLDCWQYLKRREQAKKAKQKIGVNSEVADEDTLTTEKQQIKHHFSNEVEFKQANITKLNTGGKKRKSKIKIKSRFVDLRTPSFKKKGKKKGNKSVSKGKRQHRSSIRISRNKDFNGRKLQMNTASRKDVISNLNSKLKIFSDAIRSNRKRSTDVTTPPPSASKKAQQKYNVRLGQYCQLKSPNKKVQVRKRQSVFVNKMFQARKRQSMFVRKSSEG